MRVRDVEVPWLACDLEIVTGRHHKAEEIIHLHPTSDRTLLQRGMDDARRPSTAVIERLPLPCCPLIASTRLNSSNSVVFSQRCQLSRKVSAAGAPSAWRPAFVSASFLPCRSASLAACASSGQAQALIGPWPHPGFSSVSARRNPRRAAARRSLPQWRWKLAGLFTHGDATLVDQAQHSLQVLLRRALRVVAGQGSWCVVVWFWAVGEASGALFAHHNRDPLVALLPFVLFFDQLELLRQFVCGRV